MALCRDCSRVIPCHCHVTPAAQIRPGVYLAAGPPKTLVTGEGQFVEAPPSPPPGQLAPR